LKGLKKVDPQESEEQQEHHEVERVGRKDPSEFRKADTDPHRSKNDEKKKKIVFSKQCGFLS